MSNNLVAKKYVKAIMQTNDSDKISSVLNSLKEVSTAFGDNKFNIIIDSPQVEKIKKVELIISFLQNPILETVNLIKLLGEKNRLSDIPEIVSIIEEEMAIMNNTYKGIVYSKINLTDDYLVSVASSLSAKFNTNISLQYVASDYDGVKVDIESLGVEIGFSKDRFRKSIAEYILKAV